ncbi:MAG TPA: DUF5069 domain-containing protein [Nitrospira sp.]|nr:DUF5069 domain-containing protein [Nitrospira sp.]
MRSPREKLGGYVILPRLIDKVRLHSRGQLPSEYVENLLGADPTTLDGRFLIFTRLDAEELRSKILSVDSDEEVLDWVERQAGLRSSAEKQEWAKTIESYQADAGRVAYRKRVYPDLALRVNVGALSVFDLIDMDEGRIPIPDQAGQE